MDFDKLDNRISNSPWYKLKEKHKRFFIMIQGLIVIGLMLGILIYVAQDHVIKKQIAENCGYVDSKYKCICEAHYAEDWEALRDSDFEINISNNKNVPS